MAAVPASRRYWQAWVRQPFRSPAYVDAVNQEQFWNQPNPPELTSADLGPTLRTKDLEEWCSDNNVPFPDKVAVAERVLDAVLGANPEEAAETPVFDAHRLHVLTRLRADLATRLGLG